MKVLNKLKTNIGTRTLNQLRLSNFNKIKLSQFSSQHESISSKTHLEQIQERDAYFVNKVIQSNNYTQSDFSSFLRVVHKSKNPELIEKFAQELPKQISNLDITDMRKVLSIVIYNPILRENNDLVSLIHSRNSQLNHENDISKWKNFNDLSHTPLSIRFWAGFARLREMWYGAIRNLGLNIR